jgi:hypothetical protein
MRRDRFVQLGFYVVWSLLPILCFAIEPEPLPGGKNQPQWAGGQFVAADRAGNVFFFRADTFEVYPLEKTQALGKPIHLETSAGKGGVVLEAAMSPSGDRWLVRGPKWVRLFVDGKEKNVLPLRWRPYAVGFRRDVPIVSLAPFPVQPVPDSTKVRELPWLQEWGGSAWNTLANREGPAFGELVKQLNWYGRAVEEDSLALSSDRRGRLWVANRYSYRIRELKPSGGVLTEIQLDDGKVRRKTESKGIEIQRKDPATNAREATQDPSREKATFFPFVAEDVIYDLTEGRDGRMYFLVVPKKGGLALDRYDPVLSVLERLPVQWKLAGNVTIAAGKNGLYLAPIEPEKGRWRISWESLEDGEWKKVEGATLTGSPAEVSEP